MWNVTDLSSAFCKFQTRFSKGNVATMCQRKFELLCEMLDFDSPCLSFPQILHNSVSNRKFMKDLMQWNWKLIRLFHQQCGIFILFDTLHWVHFCLGAKTWKCNHGIVANFMLCLQNYPSSNFVKSNKVKPKDDSCIKLPLAIYESHLSNVFFQEFISNSKEKIHLLIYQTVFYTFMEYFVLPMSFCTLYS